MKKYLLYILFVLLLISQASAIQIRDVFPESEIKRHRSLTEFQLDAGTADGQMMYWDNSNNKWIPTETPPASDEIVFWDNSSTAIKFLTLGAGLSITDTTITSSNIAHDVLSSDHSDTTTASVVIGDLAIGQGSPAKWVRKALGANQTFLKSDGTDALWSTITLTTNTSGNYVASITDGLAIDGGDGGSEGAALTIAFDPTELLGNRTWGDGSTDTIVWTWDRATGTDPTMTFGNDFISLNGDLKILGDDLFMTTNTNRFVLMGDGTNYNPEAIDLGTDTTGDYANSITGGTGIDSTGATSGENISHTLSFDSTELDALTWSDGSNASNVWTFNVSGIDHTMTAGSAEMIFSNNVAFVRSDGDEKITSVYDNELDLLGTLKIGFWIGGTLKAGVSSSAFFPETTNNISLGTSSKEWSNIYGKIVTISGIGYFDSISLPSGKDPAGSKGILIGGDSAVPTETSGGYRSISSELFWKPTAAGLTGEGYFSAIAAIGAENVAALIGVTAQVNTVDTSGGVPAFDYSGTLTDHIALKVISKSHVSFPADITNAYGIYIEEVSGGTSNWTIYSPATPDSAIAGDVRIGSIVAPTVALDVNGAVLISTTLGVTGNATFSGTGHDSFTDALADEHIAHSGVTLTAGTGLTGGGDITANRTFAVDGVLEDLDTLGANPFSGNPDKDFLVGTAAGTLAWQSGATARSSIGLGTTDSVTFGVLTITNGIIAGTEIRAADFYAADDVSVVGTFLSLGSDVIVDGDMASDTGWTLGGTFAIGGGVLTWTADEGNDDEATQDVAPLTVGRRYRVYFSINLFDMPESTAELAYAGGATIVEITAAGLRQSVDFTATATGIGFVGNNNGESNSDDSYIIDEFFCFEIGLEIDDTDITTYTSITIGDGGATNYNSFAADGLQTMFGTARVIIGEDIDLSIPKRPAANPPAEGTEAGFPTLDFDDGTDESILIIYHLKENYASAGTFRAHLDFFVNTAPAGAANVVWGLEYQKLSHGDNFNFSATATLTTTEAVTTGTPANDKKIHETNNFTLTTTGWVPHDIILIRLYRDANHASDTFTGDARLSHIHVDFLSDKMGEAT